MSDWGHWAILGRRTATVDPDEIAEAVLALVTFLVKHTPRDEPTGAWHVLPDVACYVYERSA